MFSAVTDFQGRAVVNQCSIGCLPVWQLFLVLAVAVGCALFSHFAFSEPVPIWAIFTSDSSDLPDDNVAALAIGPDGTLWAGTTGGLGRLDKDGHWQTYNMTNTNGGLPSDAVRALALDADGALWVGTDGGGLAGCGKNQVWGAICRIVRRGSPYSCRDPVPGEIYFVDLPVLAVSGQIPGVATPPSAPASSAGRDCRPWPSR